MANFQKSNWSRTAQAEHARVYCPAAIPNTAINFGVNSVITLTVPFQFQGPGQVQVSLPTGQVLNSNLDISTPQLLGPASGSYSLGNHPRVQFTVGNSSTGTNNTPANTDVLIVQY